MHYLICPSQRDKDLTLGLGRIDVPGKTPDAERVVWIVQQVLDDAATLSTCCTDDGNDGLFRGRHGNTIGA